jgi:hypothetical protein
MPFWNRGPAQPVDDATISLFLATFPRAVEAVRDRGWTDKDTKGLPRPVTTRPFTAFVAEHAGDSFLDGALRFLPLTGQIGLAAWNGKGWMAERLAVASEGDRVRIRLARQSLAVRPRSL